MITFPLTPVLNQLHVADNGITYKWDGVRWTGKSSSGASAGTAGADGKSAYQVAVANGFAGTEAAWLLSLKGADGGGASGILGGGFKSVTFNTVGSTSWTCPAGVTEIFVTGAGGGGGGGMYSASTGVGGGGAGAAVLKERVTTVPGVTYPIEIGRGGGNGGTGNGIAGGTTSFDWLVVLAGGEGGTTIAGGAGGVRLGVGETVNIFGTGQAPTGDFGGDGGSNHVGGVGCSGGTFMMGQFGAGGSGGNKGLNSSAGGIGFLTIEYAVSAKGDTGATGAAGADGALNSIGGGQTWNNVSGVRAANVYYWNDTGKPISLLIEITNYEAIVAELTIGTTRITRNWAYAEPNAQATKISIFAIVPDGQSYILGTDSGNSLYWYELR